MIFLLDKGKCIGEIMYNNKSIVLQSYDKEIEIQKKWNSIEQFIYYIINAGYDIDGSEIEWDILLEIVLDKAKSMISIGKDCKDYIQSKMLCNIRNTKCRLCSNKTFQSGMYIICNNCNYRYDIRSETI